MPDVIDFPGGSPSEDHIISDRPLRLRWGDWRTTTIIQVHLQTAAIYEDQRRECLAQGRDPAAQMPSHYALTGGMGETARALLRHHTSQESQIKVIYLAALMEAMVSTPCAILRTDLIRRVYQEIQTLSASLKTSWSGRDGRFLLPLGQDAADPQAFARKVSPLDNLQDFFSTLQAIADQRYHELRKGYAIYYPRHPGI